MNRILLSTLCLLSFSGKTHAILWALPVEIPLAMEAHMQSAAKKIIEKTPEPYKCALKMGTLCIAGAGLALVIGTSLQNNNEASPSAPTNEKESIARRIYDSLSSLLSFETVETAGLVLGGVSFFVSRKDIHALGQ